MNNATISAHIREFNRAGGNPSKLCGLMRFGVWRRPLVNDERHHHKKSPITTTHYKEVSSSVFWSPATSPNLLLKLQKANHNHTHRRSCRTRLVKRLGADRAPSQGAGALPPGDRQRRRWRGITSARSNPQPSISRLRTNLYSLEKPG